jgi:BASS family bile acid:Na+ symporter
VTVVPQVVAVFPAFRTLIGNGTVVVMSSYAVATLLIGHLLGGPERGNRTVLALSTASRHPGIAISIALANFTSERLAIPAVLLMVLVAAVASALYAVMSRRRMPAPVTGVPSDATPILRRS